MEPSVWLGERMRTLSVLLRCSAALAAMVLFLTILAGTAQAADSSTPTFMPPYFHTTSLPSTPVTLALSVQNNGGSADQIYRVDVVAPTGYHLAAASDQPDPDGTGAAT